MRRAAATALLSLSLGLCAWTYKEARNERSSEDRTDEFLSEKERVPSIPPPSRFHPEAPSREEPGKHGRERGGGQAPRGAESAFAFTRRLRAIEAALPTTARIRALPPAEKHGTPAIVVQAGSELGAVAEAIERNPELAPQGALFYGNCARRREISLSIRSVCLASLRELAGSTGAAPDESGMDPRVVRLANGMR